MPRKAKKRQRRKRLTIERTEGGEVYVRIDNKEGWAALMLTRADVLRVVFKLLKEAM